MCIRDSLQPKDKIHKFDQVCNEQKIKHKTTKFRSPWTPSTDCRILRNGQVEIFNKTIKNATTKKYFYTTFAHFETHLALFLKAYNFKKRLCSLKYLTPFERARSKAVKNFLTIIKMIKNCLMLTLRM